MCVRGGEGMNESIDVSGVLDMDVDLAVYVHG